MAINFPSPATDGQTFGGYTYSSALTAWRKNPDVAQGLPAGMVMAWTTATPPANWLICDGSAVGRTTYPSLFAVIGVTYGVGDGSTTFNLPDLRGRVPVGKNTATFGTLGTSGGEETHVLSAAEMPTHSHSFGSTGGHVFAWGSGVAGVVYISGTSASAGTSPGTNGLYTYQGVTGWNTTANNGSSVAHNNIQPYQVMNYIIKTSAGATAGDSQLTTRVSAVEGRATVLENTDIKGVIPTSVVVGSGTASVAADGTISFTGASSISLNGIFDALSSSDMYSVHGYVACSADPGGSLGLRLRNAGVDYTSQYYGLYQYVSATGWASPTAVSNLFGNAASFILGYRQYTSFDVNIKAPHTATGNHEYSGIVGSDGTNQVAGWVWGRTSVIGAADGLTIVPGAAVTMTGYVKIVKVA